MRTMKRSLAMAVTTVAVAGISFAGIVPATAAPAKAVAASGRNCDQYMDQAAKHQKLADNYYRLLVTEQHKAHPDRRKVAQYQALAQDEYRAVEAFKGEFRKCTNA